MRTSEEIIAIIKELRDRNGMTLEELGEKVGVAKSTLSRYESGQRKFPINDIGKYADALGTTVEHLLGVDNLYAVQGESVNIPILGEIACGEPILVKENFAGYRTEPKESLPSGTLFYLKAKGDSMYPTIPDESLVLIRQQPDVESGEIAAVLLNDETEATLKRVKKQGEVTFLLSDNTNYEPIIISELNPARIIGKALRFTQDL